MSQKAVLAGGCFWGVEELFRNLPGVIETRVGYTGGHLEYPKYEDLKNGNTNHAEAIEIIFNESETSYQEILKFFFKIHDPTTLNRQGNDIGSQYRSAIFYVDEEQKNLAQKTIEHLNLSQKWKNPVTTKLEKLGEFYLAEEVHQKYLLKNPGGYTCHYIRE